MAALAERTPSPGGGAASGVMLAMAASLCSMVAGYSETSRETEQLVERARGHLRAALVLADEDAVASRAFGAAHRLPPGREHDHAVRAASIDAARSAAALGSRAEELLPDLEWLADNGNPALIADTAVALGALRAALYGSRANLGFDLGSLLGLGDSLDRVREAHPSLFATVSRFDASLDRIDRVARSIHHRAAPTD
jgi:formiminotetrahydrofolate cyclodeaminase